MPTDTAITVAPPASPPELAVRIWWVYMVRAENGHLYTGISIDPERRFREHLSGKGARFFNRSPASALVWWQRCAGHGDALRQELQIKALTKRAKERLISQFDDHQFAGAKLCAATDSASKLGANQSETEHE
ncbi:MAG: GIY-YIG nuclease family protein [Halopseudomonas sp.]